eukprot:tig00020951_g16440.t1
MPAGTHTRRLSAGVAFLGLSLAILLAVHGAEGGGTSGDSAAASARVYIVRFKEQAAAEAVGSSSLRSAQVRAASGELAGRLRSAVGRMHSERLAAFQEQLPTLAAEASAAGRGPPSAPPAPVFAIRRELQSIFPGIIANMSNDAAILARGMSEVADVEEDGIVEATATQSGSGWNLDRIDQRLLPLNSAYTYGPTGAGVSVYVLDTGILTAHTEFEGRAVPSFDAFGGDAQDCHGHGTHVAGTVGGRTFGVAKGVTLHGVRVLDCAGSGSWSRVIAGLDHVKATRTGPAVASLSLGGGVSSSLNAAVESLVADGVVVVVSAGNNNADACLQSPASAPGAITVGATTSTDARASYSNWGSCVDIFAPGSSVASAGIASITAQVRSLARSLAFPVGLAGS